MPHLCGNLLIKNNAFVLIYCVTTTALVLMWAELTGNTGTTSMCEFSSTDASPGSKPSHVNTTIGFPKTTE
jgi:hypothetical protein